ncbi:MAG: hypothetical protein LBR86_00500 [Tannerella sp.]|jgi:hypothetical protein|nr:hypothetical protein [Tannerella sp.]
MGKTDYLPSNVLAYQKKVHNIRTRVTASQTQWDISTLALAPLDPLIAALDAAIEVSENPATRTAAAIRRRNEARTALDRVLRSFIQGRLIHNLLVSDDALLDMGLPTHDHKPTRHPVTDDTPLLSFSSPAPGIINVAFGAGNKKRRGKADDTHGMEARWLKSHSPVSPTDWSELTHSEFATRSPMRLVFEGHDRGQWIHLAARWENNRGEYSPWTEIISPVIP